MYIRIHTQIVVNKIKNHISIVSALVVAFGITISSIHIHIDDHLFAETGQIITQEEVHCFICGSIFKSVPDQSSYNYYNIHAEPSLIFLNDVNTSSAFAPKTLGRSPPV